jgi:hydroxycarboxylate dehydrogenase B
VLLRPADLAAFVTRMLTALGAPPAVAAEVSQHLVAANVAGHDSHGVQRLPQYAAQIEAGDLIPHALPEVLSRRGAVSVIDARRGFGHVAARFAAERAATAAARHGLGAAAIRHCTHIGRVGHYAEFLADRGLVSLTTVGMAGDGVGCVMPPGTGRRFLGANPWTIGIPATTGHVVVDVSSAVAAEGKVQAALAAGRPLADGIIVDQAGRPTREPADYFAGGGLLPLGGPAAGHKGFGLGLAAALLGGLAVLGDTEPTMAGASVSPDADPRGRVAGVLLLALDPAAFGPPVSGPPVSGPAVSGAAASYPAATAATIAAAHRLPGDVIVPGEPEAQARARHRAGLEIPALTWQELGRLADRLGVAAVRA